MSEKNYPTIYVLTAYGTKLLGMLLTCIHSIRKNAPAADIILVWNDMQEETVADLVRGYGVRAFRFEESVTDTRAAVRAAGKVGWWRQGFLHVEGQANLVFADIDILLVKDVTAYFDHVFDVAITVKDQEIYPINTGVLLMKVRDANSAVMRRFFETWEMMTSQILSNPDLLAVAHTHEGGYGAADQMSMAHIVGYERGVHEYQGRAGLPMTFLALPCAELNETNSLPIEPRMHIIHYKSVWQDILLHGFNFSIRRTKRDSMEMYIFYLQMYVEAKKAMAGTSILRHANIFIPPYFTKDWRIDPFRERVDYFVAGIRTLLVRFGRKMRKIVGTR